MVQSRLTLMCAGLGAVLLLAGCATQAMYVDPSGNQLVTNVGKINIQDFSNAADTMVASLIDNVIKSRADVTEGPVVRLVAGLDGEYVAVGNTVTVATPFIARHRFLELETKVVPAEKIVPPALSAATRSPRQSAGMTRSECGRTPHRRPQDERSP